MTCRALQVHDVRGGISRTDPNSNAAYQRPGLPYYCRALTNDKYAGTEIDLIISDVDGTLLNPRQELTEGVKHAVKTAASVGVPLVIATGKAIGPWTRRILPQLDTSMPQVFLQGLLVRDARGTIIRQQLLDKDILLDAIDFAAQHNLTLTAYCGDRVVCCETNEHTDRLIFYGEPTPEGIGSLKDHIGQIPIMKVLLMESEARISLIRPKAQIAFAERASLTTAIPGMLEILPLGSSKGSGVEWLLNSLGIPPSRCLAIGDGENDIEMLQLCGLGIAMGNATDVVKKSADAVVGTNAEDGVAEAISKYVLTPRGLSFPTSPLPLV